MFELIHFRDSDKIFEQKAMIADVAMTMEYIFNVLRGSLYRGELLRIALEDMDWREENTSLNIIEGRRYQYKGLKHGVAIDGSFSSYEYLLEGLVRLQVGFDTGKIEAGILMLTAKRSDKSPYGDTSSMVKQDIASLYPTINLPVGICLFDLGDPVLYDEEGNEIGTSVSTDDNSRASKVP
jgi:hypothetical protein